MKPLRSPADEQRRLEALRRYDVLDTAHEQALDDLTALAAHICDAPISLISLVDERRQWFKSAVGLSVSETPRDVSFCAHAIAQPGMLIVPDASQDERFADNPLVTGDPRIRFYAGSPLLTPEGEALGTLCVIDRVPRHLGPMQQEALRVLSRQVMAQLELRRQTRELAKSERMLRTIFDSEPECVKVLGPDGSLRMMNRAGLDMIEADSFGQVADRCMYQLVVPEHRAMFEALTERVFRGDSGKVEFQIVGLKGAARWLESHAAPLRDEHGEVTALLGITLDITERKRAEELLATHREILTATTESLAAYVERGDFQEAMGRLLRCALGQTHSEYGFIGVVVGGASLRVLAHEGIVWDKVINREFYEQALQRYEELGYVEFTNFNNLFGRAITTGQVVIANEPDHDRRSGGRPTGHPPMHNFLGVPIFAGPHVHGIVALANRPGGYSVEDQRRIETLVQHAGGLCTSYLQREAALVLEQERLGAEAARRESEERFRQLAENIQEVFWMTNPAKAEMLYISPMYEKIWGRTCASLYASPRAWQDAIHPDDHARILHATESKQARGDYDETYRILRPDGTVRWIHDRAFPVRDASGDVVRIVGTAEDITEWRHLEEQLRQSQKMEAIGQLAGGVAHDFNNILTVIQGYGSLLMMAERSPHDTADAARQIVQASERAANLTRQLLAFSRRQVMQTRLVDLNEIVTSVTTMLKRVLGEDVRLQMSLHPRPLVTRADAGMLDQVLMNLAVNARDAMPDGGQLSIETTEQDVTEDEARAIPNATAGHHVCVRITDTGTGIAPEHLSHIFEPFFTTKEPGKGTGLGLATVFGIVTQHHGSLRVDSTPDHGTTFEILLPAAEPTAESRAAAEAKPAPLGGTETVLIVEDEPSVRMLTRIVLERHGYKVLEAAHGVDALRVWEQHEGVIQLVLTDIVMPEGMNGRELAARLRARDPKLRVIFTSGYSADFAGRELSLQDGQNFIQKPSSPQQLLETVRRCLDT